MTNPLTYEEELAAKYPPGTKGRFYLDWFCAEFFRRRGWTPETIAVVEYSCALTGSNRLRVRWGTGDNEVTMINAEDFEIVED